MAPHSSILAWKIPWTEESDRLQFMMLSGQSRTQKTTLCMVPFTRNVWNRKHRETESLLVVGGLEGKRNDY